MLDTGDEVTGELGKFVREQEVEAASVTAIGAFSRAVLGYFQWETKQYKKIPVGEQVEVLSLLGDVAVGDPGPTLHLHCGPRGTPIVEARQCFVLAHGAADAVLGKAIGEQILGFVRSLRKRGGVEQIGQGRGVRWKLLS